MQCFDHPERAAVGTCRACGRGLCADSLAEASAWLACRGRCEADVRALLANLRYGSRMVGSARGIWLFFAAFLILNGVGSISYGLQFDQGTVNAWTILGVLSIVAAAASLRVTRKLRSS